jgi:UDP-N-acetylmuramoyl-tripeptide--D-alanyl-D-alanine ligase
MGGELAPNGGDGTTLVTGASVDSREIRRGDVFFALRGRVDGAEFAPEAALRGAVAAVADRPLSVPTVVVDDPLAALGELARWSLTRDDAPTPPPTVVGITGSVGKTTTKDALAGILRSEGRKVHATAGNFNNEIGLPLTVLAAPENTEVLVLEMGATHSGDITHLARIAPPRVGILTAVSPVHLDSFGSLEALAAAKGELALALPENGAFVHPWDAPKTAIGPGRSLQRLSFSTGNAPADLSVEGAADVEGGLYFKLKVSDGALADVDETVVEVKTPVFGTHLVASLLAACGGALALEVEPEGCAKGLKRLRRTGLRGEVIRLRDDIVVYDDSYNASPAAVAAVLRYGAGQAAGEGRRFVAVLGGMFELGSGAREYHREAGALASEAGVDVLACVGDEARWYAEGFKNAAGPGEVLVYPDAEAAGGVEEELRAGDFVVVKGSRGVGLDRLTRRLRERLALV